MPREIVVGLHFYQPPREAFHPSLTHISTDPKKENWTAIIDKQCYEPLSQLGLLNKVSFDIYQSLLLQMEKLDPSAAIIFKQSMKENGIGEAFIHPILPDLSRIDKQIVISAGVNRFCEITGDRPKTFWPPETAIDTDTLEVLAENGYESFVCAAEQIIQNDGSRSDNQPTLILLPSGRRIVALPFDRPLSSDLANKPKDNADQFTQQFVVNEVKKFPESQPIIAWTDGETFGHHYPFGDLFLDYFLSSSLPNIGLYPVSINSLKFDPGTLPIGKINERTAWSCPHGNLSRWHGLCQCDNYYGNWKPGFQIAFNNLNQSVSQILLREIGPDYSDLVASSFYLHYSHPETINNPAKALIAAKISSLVSLTSCATFFASPETSGKINLLYGYQTILYLHESGLTQEAEKLNGQLINDLSQISFPGYQRSAADALSEMLGG